MNKRIKITKDDLILQTVVSILLPFAVMLALFVILNGHISPGGGFSGGVILGASFILHNTAFSSQRMERILNDRSISVTMATAIIIYGLLKTYSFMMGAAQLETGIPLGTPGKILSGGLILPLNICVGIIVSLSMYIFYSLYTRGEI